MCQRCPAYNLTTFFSAQKNVASVMGALSSTSSSFGNVAASSRLDNANGASALFIDDTLKQQALAEEEAAMNQYKVRHENTGEAPGRHARGMGRGIDE